MARRISRRSWLRDAATIFALPAILPAQTVKGYQANERLGVALVGVGGRGSWFVETIPRLEKLVALCDVNGRRITEAFNRWKELADRSSQASEQWLRRGGAEYRALLDQPPKMYRDFRQMLEDSGEAIDAVVVATPDHTHAVASAAAIRAGKHVFCEKPLTRTVHESRALRELARKYKVATAMGNQGTYSGAFRRALELIRDGVLGEISEVHVWNDAGGADRRTPPEGEPPIPGELDWDLWLGPVAYRKFHPQWMQRNLWREFGTGQLGNWGSHTANLAFMALKVYELWSETETQKPQVIRCTAKTSGLNRLSFPRWEIVEWEIPARREFPPITIRWWNGDSPGFRDLVKPIVEMAPEKDRNLWRFAGTLLVGTEGTIHTTGHNMWFQLLPAEKFSAVQRQRPERFPDSRGPEQDWFAACRGGPAPWSQFDYAVPLNEFLMLGNIATQFEETLEYDPLANKIVNHPEADALLRYEYREGWVL